MYFLFFAGEPCHDSLLHSPPPQRTFKKSNANVKAGVCCMNLECCCKPGAPLLMPCGFLGCKPECDGCSVLNGQCQAMCLVVSAAIPCNNEVPVAVAIAGLTLYHKCGFCIQQRDLFDR
jgi:hypothetical protein